LFIYKELNLKKLLQKFGESSRTTGGIMIIVATGTILGRVLTLEQIPQTVSQAITGMTDSRIVVLLIVNLMLLVVGCLMETTSAILILAPILTPIVAIYGVSPIQFGLIMVVNLAIGFITPPVGVNLFIACGIGNVKFQELIGAIVPFLLALLVALILITYIPAISTFLPSLVAK